jgi:hypothetical protein
MVDQNQQDAPPESAAGGTTKLPSPPKAVARAKAKGKGEVETAKPKRKVKRRKAKRTYRRKADNFEVQLKQVLKLYRQAKATGKMLS